MENSYSSILLELDKKFIWNQIQERQKLSYNAINNQFFYYEKNNIYFIDTRHEPDFFPFSKKKKHKSKYLVKLLLGFYEELENIPSILETIIESDINPENNVIKYLNNHFFCHTQNMKNRTLVYKRISEFSMNFFSPFGMVSIEPIKNSEDPTFSIFLSSISTSFLILEDHKFPFQSYIPFINFINNSITTASITPPSPEFLPEEKDSNINDQSFTADYVNPHGICSNGNFLFILCSNNNIQIFPLFNGGSISSAIVAHLDQIDFEIPQDASLNAFEDTVQIIYSENDEYKVLMYEIDSLIKNNFSIKTSPTKYQFNCNLSCSDGIIQIIIEPDHSFRVFDLIQKKQLSTSNFDQSLSKLPEDLTTTVVETNGSCISFIFQLQTDEQDDNNDNNDNNNNNLNFAVYKTFSYDGSFLKEEKFVMNDPIIASCIDSINRCHWSVIPGGNSRFYIRRFNLIGGENPEIFKIDRYLYPTNVEITPLSFVGQLISSLHRHLRGMINSQISPNLFLVLKIDDFLKLIQLIEKVMNLPNEKFGMFIELKQAIIECLVILTSLNLKRIGCTSKPIESISTKIFEIVKKLPLNLSSILFFSNFDYLMFDQKDEIVMFLIELLKSMEDKYLIKIAFRMMEQSKSLSMIRFKKSNSFYDLFPQDCTNSSSIEPIILMFLLLHQRVLVRHSFLFLQENHLAVINIKNIDSNEATVIDLLGDYMQNIFSILLNVFAFYSPEKIEDLAIFDLFLNFINLLSSLNEFHSVAQFAASFTSVIVNKLTEIFKSHPKEVLNIVFILGKLASTLLKGDEVTNLETKFSWLISSNIDLIEDQQELIENLDDNKIEYFEDERINCFLDFENDSLKGIYKKIKPLVNKNLNYQIKQIDKLSILAFSKHLNCIDELLFFDESSRPSSQLRSAFDQMLVVRNEFRRSIQNKKDTTIFTVKCLMLFRMKSSLINIENSKKLSDFVIMKFEPSDFKKIIIGQRNRIKTTLIGFSLLDQNYVLNSDPLIHEIFNYCLSTIKSFENIDSIFKISKLNETNLNQIFLFFDRMIKNASKEKSMHLILVCYRFFRDVDCLNDVKNSILKTVLEIYKKMSDNDSMFALALSLINKITEIPSQLLKIDSYNNLSNWILLLEATKNVSPPNDFISFLLQYFINHEISCEITRLILRVIYNFQEQITDSEIFFYTCFLKIGKEIQKVHNFSKSSEIIHFLRRILISDSAPLKSNLINYILNFEPQNINEELWLGIMATLGLNIEEIHPFSVVNYHQNRSELNQYYVISYEKNEFICYPKPFRINSSKIISIPNKSNVYAIPQTEILPDKFPYYEYILQYFYLVYQFCCSNPLVYAIYMQIFASYCRSPEFVSLISEDILSILYADSIPFHDIQSTIEYINKINCAKITPQFLGFNVLSLNSKYTTFLSPAIEKNADIFEIIIHFPKTPKDELYFGIVSDNLEPHYTRYSLVSFPDGTLYPKNFNSTEDQFKKVNKDIQITVYMKSKKFKINEKEFKFPIGSQFRVLFATSMKNHHLIEIQINSNSVVFNNEAPVPIQTFNVSKESVLYPSYTTYGELPYDYNKLPEFPQIVYNYSDIEKFVFIQPKTDDIVIHGFNSNFLSEELFSSLLFASFRKLAFQYSSVSLMRIINTNINFAKPIVFKFYQYLIYLVESFSISLMELDNFPFDMTMPVWNKDVDPIYFSLENEAKKCLQKIVSDPENVEIIAQGIESLFNSKRIHSLMFPQESLRLFFGDKKNLNLYRDKSYILFHNDFDVSTNESIRILQEAVKLPVAYTTRSKAVLVDILDDKRITGYLCINPMNNDWLINTPIEMLLLLKNFIFIAISEEHQKMIKSVILDCFILNSPVASLYLNQFADLIMSQIPPSMSDQGQKYVNQLGLVGSRLKNNYNQTFISFYQREQLMFNKMALELASHFPEFLQTPFPSPNTKICRIPLVVIDPCDLTVNFSDHISSIRTFIRPYRSLVGFPFWEILPYWIKLTDSNLDLNSNSYNKPQATRINNEIIKVSNPMNSSIKAYLKKRVENQREIPEDSFLMCSKSSDFRDCDYINFAHFSDHISINRGDTFFALYLPDQQNSWDLFYLDLEYNEPVPNRRTNDDFVFVDESQIRDHFIDDMRQFAVEWRENETYELLNQIPDDKFTNEKFDEIERIARLSSLSSKYNSTVVVLRALILHHYNYIFSLHQNEVSEEIWSTTNSLLSIETQSQVALSRIPSSTRVPSIEIDRQKSQFLVAEKKGDRSNSIISQLSYQINRIGAFNFRNKAKPWNVVYKNERGIDAGGLSRDLIVEASASVFQPTSELMVQIDNSTRDETCFYYVPNENALDELDEFYSIGVLIGIIIRTGFIQDFPLAPFIWKWIAGEVITDDDIFDCDRNFRLLFNSSNSSSLKWSAVCWNGNVSCLKNRNPNSVVSREQIAQYQHECIAFRKQSIKPMVEQMRKGFYNNIGFSINYKLRGLLLSRLAQGSGIITIEQLKKITVVSVFAGGMNNEYIQRFWRAVSRFDKNELKLLFKFITSLTRIPSDSRLNNKFTITIDMLERPNPDSALPNSSTCFNQLHLPCYTNDETAYRKILYAVKYCSSMENY